MAYTSSNAFSPRGTILSYQTSVSIGYVPVIEMKQIDFTGQKLDLADVTNYNSGIFKEWLATLLDSGELSFKGNFVPNDATQLAMLGFFNTAERVSWQVTLPLSSTTGQPLGHFTFLAFVSGFDIGLPIDKEGTVTGKLKITGAITFVSGS